MYQLLFGVALFLMLSPMGAWAKVRHVPVVSDQIVVVRTALGIATIIQVPDRPNSVVVGDQEAFKVEYLDQAITIKPLHGGAKSNLYIYTDWRRFNVQLVSGSDASADYVVYLENEQPKRAKQNLSWTPFSNKLVNESITLEIKRLGRTREGLLLIDFEIICAKKQKVKPDWLWVTQYKQTRPIHNLFLSSLECKTDQPVKGTMQVLSTDLATNESMRIEVRRAKVSFLTIPKVNSWK